MKQFYETYAENAEKLSTLLREIAPEAKRVAFGSGLKGSRVNII